MKLTLPVPVEKVQITPYSYTFRHEPREVDVLVLTREPASRDRSRWHLSAHFDHPDAHHEAPRVGINRTLVAWIRRADHPGWKPPEFPAGASAVTISPIPLPNVQP